MSELAEAGATTGTCHGRTVLWEPPVNGAQSARLRDFLAWVGQHRGIPLADYREALTWSVADVSTFWDAVREYFDVLGSGFSTPALAVDRMPGAIWHPQARLNYAENVLRQAADPAAVDTTAIVELSEDGSTREISWGSLSERVASLAAGLRRLGVRNGDAVAAVLPNIPEAIIGLLAAASIGAVWCICSPDLGVGATLDRLGQLDPVVLIGLPGYEFNGRWFDTTARLDSIETGLPTLRSTIVVAAQYSSAQRDDSRVPFHDLLADRASAEFAQVPFDHPLWVLFTWAPPAPPRASSTATAE